MKVRPARIKKTKKQPTILDVINDQLTLAHKLHPGHLMAGAVVAALEAEGYRILSDQEHAAEMALAHQAGYEEAVESVGSAR